MEIGDRTFHKRVVMGLSQYQPGFEVSGIRKIIKINNTDSWILGNKMSYEVRTDKAGPARNQECV